MVAAKRIPQVETVQEILNDPVLSYFAEQKLLDRVVRAPSGCWEWRGPFYKSGYGCVNFALKRNFRAHRLSYLLLCGPIPDGMFVCHCCDNRRCIRPDHLFLGNNSDNQKDSGRKGRHWSQRNGEKTHVRHMTREQRSRFGEENGYSKTTAATVRQIREMKRSGMSPTQISAIVMLHPGHVRKIIQGKAWAHIQ